MLEPRQTKRRDLDVTDGVEIRTGARLHFGLMDVRPPFGGAGMMVDQPVTHIRVEAAERFQISGPAQDRVRAVAERFAAFLPHAALPACRIIVLERPEVHSGLGTGTQLAFAVAQGLARWCGLELSEEQISRNVANRGQRSIIGSAGFHRGGLLVDRDPPLRYEVPEAWRVLLLQPKQPVTKVSGAQERRKFAELQAASPSQRQQLSDLLEKCIVPAVQSGDFDTFSEAIYRYNYHSGMLFAPVQQGPYNGQPVADLIQTLRDHNISGVGQSSWGPTVFAFSRSAEQAEQLLKSTPLHVFQSYCVRPINHGYQEAIVGGDVPDEGH